MMVRQRHTPNDTLNAISVVGVLIIAVGLMVLNYCSSDATVKHDCLTIVTAIVSGLIGFLSRGLPTLQGKNETVPDPTATGAPKNDNPQV